MESLQNLIGVPGPLPDSIGHSSGQKISVELGTRFLEHFSEQLYSSPQKAFEELISNGWDAGANCVDVRISTGLKDPNATMCVLDNGASMDAEGLRLLWRIAFSPKKGKSVQYGRPIIGQFGIGKLATYVLANKLTYICKAADGIIRRVTMNYDIDALKDGAQDKLISDIYLDIFEVDEGELEQALQNVFDGTVLLNSIRNGIPCPTTEVSSEDEFGAPKSTLDPPKGDTWTLAVLSELKSTGRDLKVGILRRMLQTALPFGSEMAIFLNGERLNSSKISLPKMEEWTVGPDLEITSIEIDERDSTGSNEITEMPMTEDSTSDALTVIPIAAGNEPVPHVSIPGIGIITGQAQLFVDKISGGRSDERGASNGFHVNVLGRIVNQDDPSFGEKNLNHAAWARFRMTVRADGLNQLLTINRENFQERRELKIFRAFLRKVFNKARTYYDSDQNAELPDGGDLLVRSLGVLSLAPLRNVVSEALTKQTPVQRLFDESGIIDRAAKWKSWRENTADNIKNVLGQVRYERVDDDSFVKFRIADNTIVINKEHPFVAEHSRTKAEKELMRTIAMVDLLTDVYALDIGVEPQIIESIREYRDRLMRFRAMQQRQSGTHIAKLLLQTQHDSSNSKRMEAVLSDALRYLGFSVRDLGKPGEPEGIAAAYSYPTQGNPTKDEPHPPLYSFSFDAKSSKHEVAKTGNVSLDGVVEHRNRYKANHALVVAPGFQEGAISTRCEEQNVTPMTAHDLGKLLEYTVEYGAIPLTKLREVFARHDPAAVSQWVDDLENWLKSQRHLTIDVFLRALSNLKGKVPDLLAASVIAYECREKLGAVSVKDDEVIAVARGLSILVPDLVGVDKDKIVVNASPERVAAAVKTQLENLQSDVAI